MTWISKLIITEKKPKNGGRYEPIGPGASLSVDDIEVVNKGDRTLYYHPVSKPNTKTKKVCVNPRPWFLRDGPSPRQSTNLIIPFVRPRTEE